MRKNLLTTSAAALALLSIVGCSSGATDTGGGAGDWPEEITISLVPSVEGEDLAEALDPLTSYLSEELGITVNGVVATDYAATVEALGADQAQVIITDAGLALPGDRAARGGADPARRPLRRHLLLRDRDDQQPGQVLRGRGRHRRLRRDRR